MTIEELVIQSREDPSEFFGFIEHNEQSYPFFLHTTEDGKFFFYGEVEGEVIVSPQFKPEHEYTPEKVWNEGYLSSESNVIADGKMHFDIQPFTVQARQCIDLIKERPKQEASV